MNNSLIKTNSKIDNSIQFNYSAPIKNLEIIRNASLVDSTTFFKPNPYLNKTINEKYIRHVPSSISHIPNNLTYLISQKIKENSTSELIELKVK
jgi:hypothetical protein